MKRFHFAQLLVLVLLFSASVTLAQTTTFTYQGKLTDAGNPANGSYDLQFKLFDTVTVGAGAQQGATLVRNPVAASAGVFTVTLDFGANVFSGADRYLEIGVRPAGSGSAYTVLSPRQPVTASPYAIQTLNAQQLGGLPASGFLQNTSSQQAGANFNIGGNGTVGSLNANGAVSLGGSAAPATAPAGQGRLYFDTATNKVKVSENGADYVNLVGASGVSGSGAVNSIPFWSAGTTLGNSQITQSVNGVQLPNGVQLAVGAQGNQLSFGSPNGETGLSIAGASSRADLRFDGTLKLVAGTGVVPPAATNGLAITTAGKVGIGTITPAFKLEVISSDTSIVGKSTGAGAGVYGESAGFDGVHGIGHDVNHGAVVGVHDANGIAVYGTSSGTGVFGDSTSGAGVYGRTTAGNATVAGVYGVSTSSGGVGVTGEATTGVYGKTTSNNGIGVTGEANTSNGIGVYGTSTSATGYGVFANNPSGIALGVAGNATQNRDKGGIVKAMAYVDDAGAILRCYNGQTNSSTGNCGFTVDPNNLGVYKINFGFQVTDRFVSITSHYGGGGSAGYNFGANFVFFDSTTVDVITYDANAGDDSHARAFMIFIF